MNTIEVKNNEIIKNITTDIEVKHTGTNVINLKIVFNRSTDLKIIYSGLESKLNIEYIVQYRINGCKDVKPLPFDFYLPKYNILIEYDGLGHYNFNDKSEWRTKENVLLTQKHDNIKTKYCEDNNIKLIRIPYYDYNKLNEEYLLSLINW